MSQNFASLCQISDKRKIFVCQSIFAPYKNRLYFNSTRYFRKSDEKISLSVFSLFVMRNRLIRIVVKSTGKKYFSQIRMDPTLMEISKYIICAQTDEAALKSTKYGQKYIYGDLYEFKQNVVGHEIICDM